MASIYQVDPNALIEEVAKELKKMPAMHPPEWAPFVKTGIHKQRAPVNPDWWYIRAAAILRTIFVKGPVGVEKLRTKYGGRQNRGMKPEKFAKASGNLIRKILQALEVESLIVKSTDDTKKGRIIAPKGQSVLEKAAGKVLPKKAVVTAEVSKEKPSKKTPAKEDKESKASEDKE
jgi:small subunit ribosomal protein S19e